MPSCSIWTNFSNFSGVGGALPPQSTSLSLAWEIAYVYLLPPTPEKFQKFVHIEALGKNCISAPDSVFSQLLIVKRKEWKMKRKAIWKETSRNLNRIFFCIALHVIFFNLIWIRGNQLILSDEFVSLIKVIISKRF